MKKIKELFLKYKEQILYLFFGGVTTVVCMICIAIFEYQFNIVGIKARVPSDIIAIIVAYITNKIWVFESKCENLKALIQEIISFFGARAFTLILSAVIVLIFVDKLGWNNMIVNLVATFITIVLNYVFSKLFIFKNKR